MADIDEVMRRLARGPLGVVLRQRRHGGWGLILRLLVQLPIADALHRLPDLLVLFSLRAGLPAIIQFVRLRGPRHRRLTPGLQALAYSTTVCAAAYRLVR